jgi:hypothetical protein
MFRVFLIKDSLIVYDKSEKEFRQKYGNTYEQVSIIKDSDNIDKVTEKLLRQYNASEIELDFKVKKVFGWKLYDEQAKQEVFKKISKALKRYVKTEEHRRNLSAGCKHMKSFLGKKHTEETKLKMRVKHLGKDVIKGRMWMYNPITGEEKRGYELLPNMIWGRSPENRDNFKRRRKLYDF